MKFLKEKQIEKSYLLVLGVLSIFLIGGYFSYAIFTVQEEKTKAISIVTGTLNPTLTSTDSAFSNNQIVVPASTTEEITIKLTNNNNRDAKFNFYYIGSLPSGVSVGYVESTKDIPPDTTGIVLGQGKSEEYTLKIVNNSSSSFTLRIESDRGLFDRDLSFPSNGQTFTLLKYQDASGANAPVLADNMIPVVYSETNTRWEKADTTSEWYNYGNQMWANAVTVTDASRSTYQSANPGMEVKMDDILQMYVWIPRYSYTIKSENGIYYYGKKEEGRTDPPTQVLPGEIDVKFLSSDTKEDGSAQYTGSNTPSGWYTPPGFTFGEKELPGIWVGKFETGYRGATFRTAAKKDTVEPNKVIIKPKSYSWTNIRVSTLDLVSRGIVSSGNIYGFDATYDSHAMKNTEWALVSYLTQSKYGKYGNSMYTGANKEIYTSDAYYETGCSAGSPTGGLNTCNLYDDITDQGNGKGAKGAGASTTGNIYGIYDMSGSAQEIMMMQYNNYTGGSEIFNSGYTGKLGDDGSSFTGREWPDTKYYDFYTEIYPSLSCGENACKGHALNETHVWYSDADYSDTGYYWIARGGGRGDSLSGIFNIRTAREYGEDAISFRIVLAP